MTAGGAPLLVVAGGTVLTPDGPRRADVVVAGGRIAGVGGDVPAAAPVLAADGLLVGPGLIDLQCNGAVGIDLATAPERLWEMAAALPRGGVTAWLPTIVTGPPEVRRRALAALRAGPPPGDDDRPRAEPLGLHLEGPFLAPERRGAHPAEHLAAPDPAVVAGEGWAGAVRLATLAPELPRALDLVRALVAAGIVVSAGHSSATAAEARAAAAAGATYVTHLFNAMAPLGHRAPGLPGVALGDERFRVGLIADGVHVDPVVVAVAARALGDRLTLVTDAVAPMGTPGAGDAARLPDGTLAGSTLTLDQAVRNLAQWAGLPLAAALAAATSAPARVLGLADRGTIAVGAVADLVLLDEAGGLVATVAGGRVAHDRRTAQAPGDAP
jgi:N-acetylglucosamine-6-phosphate deacetylase